VASVAASSPGAADLAARIDSLEAKAAGAGAPIQEPDPAAVLAAACKRLPDDAAVVEFLAYDRTSRGAKGDPLPSYAAVLIRPPGCTVTIHPLGGAAPIEAAAQRFDAAMREQRSDEQEALAELGKRLLAPLEEGLRGTSRWFVIPDGRLWGVPVGALPDPEDGSRYVLERVTVAYLTSIYELAEAPGTPLEGEPQKALLFGAPDFGPASKPGPVVLTRSGPCELAPFAPLPGARSEIEDLASLLASPRVVTGADATRQRFYAELAKGPSWIHLATHGYFAGRDGCQAKPVRRAVEEDASPLEPDPLLRSGIVLAGANASARVGEEGGGILTSYEIARLDFRDARLVVLSACDTGSGLEQRGQEVQGLRWAFRAAGAHALVTSVWTSNDAVTRELMHDFYAALHSSATGRDVFEGAEALRRAQLARVADDRRLGLRRPLLWANFVFSGVL
jgi:CHAT domain-containing protein